VIAACATVYGWYKKRIADKLQAERDALQKKSVELHERIADLKEKSVKLEAERTKLAEKSLELGLDVRDLKQRANQLQVERNELHANSLALQAEVRDLQKRSTDLKEKATQLQYFAELRAWAGQAVDTLSEAVHLCDFDPRIREPGEFTHELQRHRLRCRLSAHIDRGRWFFPNVQESGPQQEASFKGYRHEIVQTLYEAYDAVGKLRESSPDGNQTGRERLHHLQRKFVRRIQRVLNPGTLNQVFRRIVERQGSEETRMFLGRIREKIRAMIRGHVSLTVQEVDALRSHMDSLPDAEVFRFNNSLKLRKAGRNPFRGSKREHIDTLMDYVRGHSNGIRSPADRRQALEFRERILPQLAARTPLSGEDFEALPEHLNGLWLSDFHAFYVALRRNGLPNPGGIPFEQRVQNIIDYARSLSEPR